MNKPIPTLYLMSSQGTIFFSLHFTKCGYYCVQGRDKDCILVSFVRSSEKMSQFNSSILEDWHRINVALTRAKVYP